MAFLGVYWILWQKESVGEKPVSLLEYQDNAVDKNRLANYPTEHFFPYKRFICDVVCFWNKIYVSFENSERYIKAYKKRNIEIFYVPK